MSNVSRDLTSTWKFAVVGVRIEVVISHAPRLVRLSHASRFVSIRERDAFARESYSDVVRLSTEAV